MPLSESTSSRTKPPRGSVLIVDDDETMRRLLELALLRYDFRVYQAGDGREAIDLFRRFGKDIDVVVLDVRMPGYGGPETLADLRQIQPDLRAVFVTGYTGEHSEEELLAQGASRIFHKPFPLIEFADYLRQLITPV
jgi:two-component system, OmpR family, response regulator